MSRTAALAFTANVVSSLFAEAAKRSATHRQVSWPLDRCTMARIRIGRLWQRRPTLTARQVIQTLGPGPFLTVQWVQQVLREYRRAAHQHRSGNRRTGRRRYSTAPMVYSGSSITSYIGRNGVSPMCLNAHSHKSVSSVSARTGAHCSSWGALVRLHAVCDRVSRQHR